MTHPREVVVVGVEGQAAVVKRPREVVHGVLLVLDGARHHLGADVVRDEVVQVALHGEGLEQKLFVILLARCVAHEHGDAGAALLAIRLRGRAHHLQQVRHRVVRASRVAAVKVLRAHHHNQLAPQRGGPRHGRRAHHHLDGPRLEQRLHRLPLRGEHALVQKRHPEADGVLERRLPQPRHERREVLLRALQEPLRSAVGGCEREQVQGGEAGVLARGHVHHPRTGRDVLHQR
mmetsp:Transcript_717/g.1490  ORF Transcript_717/g.1490 Transcript_717/m.1490 type:complete len:233 (+) Transcript_717:1662-2360(+)